MNIILKADQIAKTYAKGTQLATEALKPTDLQIEQGRFYAVVGRSGSGKSTLLNILGGLDKPSSGKLYLEGKSVFDLRDGELAMLRRKRIGFVFQAYNLLTEHTAHENMLMPLHLDGREVDKAHFDEVVEALGLTDKLKNFPDELSGGEQQRVAIARALLSKPAILLADEPTGNLDPKTGDEVLALLKTLAKRYDQTVILITHDMEIAALADSIITLHDGHVASITDTAAKA